MNFSDMTDAQLLDTAIRAMEELERRRREERPVEFAQVVIMGICMPGDPDASYHALRNDIIDIIGDGASTSVYVNTRTGQAIVYFDSYAKATAARKALARRYPGMEIKLV